MKICPKCKQEHNKNGLYCSRKCANSRKWTIEDKVKKSISALNSEKVKNSKLKGISKKPLTIEEKEKRSNTMKKNHMTHPEIRIKIQQSRANWSDEYRESVRKKMSLNAKGSGGRAKGVWYESTIAGKVFLHGSWEVEYAKYLDRNNVKWKRNKIKFPYTFKNKQRFYTPDFYLINSNEYIEIKGCKTEKDECKWIDFPYKLTVLFKKELLNLGCNIR